MHTWNEFNISVWTQTANYNKKKIANHCNHRVGMDVSEKCMCFTTT